MKKKIFVPIITCMLLSTTAFGQTLASIVAEKYEKEPFAKNFRWGVSFNMYWSKLVGDQLPVPYYGKPSLGFNIRAEYYFASFLGVGLGVGYQQRGSGIINPDNSGGAFSHPWVVNKYGTQGDPDSTYLEKLRFNSIEVPLTILLRTPKDLIRGIRPSAGVGLIYIYNIRSNDVFQSVIDGFHKDNAVTDAYIRNDLGYQLSLGADIDAGGNGTMFQLHFVYTEGLGNVYAIGQGNGHQITYGVRLSCLF